MALMTPVTIPAETWTLVADAVQNGIIYIKKPNLHGYMFYYDADGGSAPTLASQGVPFDGNSVIINNDVDIDVYVWSWKNAGQVIVGS